MIDFKIIFDDNSATDELLIKKEDSKILYSPVSILNPSSASIVSDPVRIEILKLLSKSPMYPAEIARTLALHEQKVYYHIKQLSNAGLLSVSGKQDIRGTTAKKYSVKSLNYAFCLDNSWKEIQSLGTIENDKKLDLFLAPFIKNGELDADIVVGSPDPHGPFKARARDSHYAINLALFLGNYCKSSSFAVRLDVDASLQTANKNLILVGGPVTNLLVSQANEHLSIRFRNAGTWEIYDELKNKVYREDSVGIIARIQNPYNNNLKILLFAGVRFIGTKSAVIALINNKKELLNRFNNQKEFIAVVQGFDLDGDGKIDSAEVL